MEKAKIVFRDMGKGMWTQGKGFAKVGALYSGTECIIEGVRPHFLRSTSLLLMRIYD